MLAVLATNGLSDDRCFFLVLFCARFSSLSSTATAIAGRYHIFCCQLVTVACMHSLSVGRVVAHYCCVDIKRATYLQSAAVDASV